jgi:uncharacterized protein
MKPTCVQKLFDINTAIGHWPFRKVPCGTACELSDMLEAAGITEAATVNTHGLFYKNCHDANLELADELASHDGVLVGVATLNPLYAAWERDLRACREELGMAALRLAPQYHDYELNCPQAVALATAATELKMPLLVPHRVVDIRQRHWFDAERTVGPEEIGALCTAVPEAVVVVTESPFGPAHLLDEQGAWRYPGLYVESSRTSIGAFPEAVAARRVIFGTGAPFKHVEPALLKLETAQVEEPSRRRIAATNALDLLVQGASAGAQ